MTEPDLKADIAREIYTALERLRGDPDLLAIIGTWKDTLADREVLSQLQDYNQMARALHPY